MVPDLFGNPVPEDCEPTFEERYQAYLRSAAWRKRRGYALARAGNRCEGCGVSSLERRLEVHHITYDRLGFEDLRDLRVLCPECHERADEKRDEATCRRAARRAREANYAARLDGWATKVYGDDWDSYPGYQVAEDSFDRWLDRKLSL